MSRIKTVALETASGIRRFLLRMVARQSGGFIPGIVKIALVDLKVGRPTKNLYQHLHLRKDSPFSRLQREMVATVVNGAIGGAA